MKRILAVAFVSMLALSFCVPALAHTGGLPELDYEWVDETLTTLITSHDETLDNTSGWYKGWWMISLTNRTSVAWAGVTISSGVGDLVAIVEGLGLVDEDGVIGDSVFVNRPSSVSYLTALGPGSRTYENGATGQLWQQAIVSFAAPVATGQKVSFKVYTDNSYYEGPYASTFSVAVTPNAVPEPGSILAVLSGLAGLAGYARRRK